MFCIHNCFQRSCIMKNNILAVAFAISIATNDLTSVKTQSLMYHSSVQWQARYQYCSKLTSLTDN